MYGLVLLTVRKEHTLSQYRGQHKVKFSQFPVNGLQKIESHQFGLLKTAAKPHTALEPLTVNVLFLNMPGYELDLSYQTTQPTLTLLSIWHILQIKECHSQKYCIVETFLRDPSVTVNVIQNVRLQPFKPLNVSGMLPFSLTRGQSLPPLYSEFGLGTLSE